jgi:hypothetical protein
LLGIGLTVHMALDAIDCKITNGVWINWILSREHITSACSRQSWAADAKRYTQNSKMDFCAFTWHLMAY